MRSPTFASEVTSWYAVNARDLPWRRDETTAWGVLVSEAMLQQTPVARVLPVWQVWMQRWPTPAALAMDSVGEAVRAWGRLGYPRRALRLHLAATAIVERHDGRVPSAVEALRSLPGVGDYTAAAVAAFAFGARVAVLDTNVRRVQARVFGGVAEAPSGAPTVTERRTAEGLLPPLDAPGFGVAVMELGALVCTARAPRCGSCPVSARCRWLAAGQPESDTRRRGQSYVGTDRQARGRLLGVLRESGDPVAGADLDVVWADGAQRRRALDGLVADGLVEPLGDGRYRLPA
jgi:A/G-specific adenine glycosylase